MDYPMSQMTARLEIRALKISDAVTLLLVLWIAMGAAFAFADDHTEAGKSDGSSVIDQILSPAYGMWGLGAVARQPNYPEQDVSIDPAPFIFGGYGPIFIEANRFGYNFYRDGTWFSSVVGNIRNQYQREESENTPERQGAFEAGIQLGRRLGGDWISRLAFLQDVSNEHNSFEVDVQFYRRDFIGDVTILTAIGMQYQPKDFVDYYYQYKLNETKKDQFVGELEVIGAYDFSNDWRGFIGTRNYCYLGDLDGTLYGKDQCILQNFMGVGYRF